VDGVGGRALLGSGGAWRGWLCPCARLCCLAAVSCFLHQYDTNFIRERINTMYAVTAVQYSA
jgi:hypothetical protein